MGVTVRAVNIRSFDDWLGQTSKGEEVTIGPVTMFFPMQRVERIFLDEDVGMVDSLSTRFRAKTGMSIENYFDDSNDDTPLPH